MGIPIGLGGRIMIPTTNYVNLNVAIGIISTSFFSIMISIKIWLVLPQLIQVNVDLTITTITTNFITPLISSGCKHGKVC